MAAGAPGNAYAGPIEGAAGPHQPELKYSCSVDFSRHQNGKKIYIFLYHIILFIELNKFVYNFFYDFDIKILYFNFRPISYRTHSSQPHIPYAARELRLIAKTTYQRQEK